MQKKYTKSWLDNDTAAAWLFLTPALILLGVFIIWPIAYLFYLSFTAGSFTLKGTYWIGLKNYWRLLKKLLALATQPRLLASFG